MYLEKIRIIRKQKGLSQKALGELIGLEQSAYSKIENGSNILSVPTLLHICNALNVSVNEILNQSPIESNSPIVNCDDSLYKLELYNRAIEELQKVIDQKQAEIDLLKNSRKQFLNENRYSTIR